jgi:hypothetical protein
MTPLHAVSAPALSLARPAPAAPAPRGPPLATLAPHGRASLTSALLLALLVLAFLLQASFFVGLASGRVGGPDAWSEASVARSP